MKEEKKDKIVSTLEWAEFYLSQGFSLIPLLPKDKTPAIQWKEYQHRKPTQAELIKWFSNGRNNIGIVTGKISGIAVIDLDSEAALNFAKQNDFSDTPSVKTGKGCHLYYKYPDNIEVRNFQKRDDLPDIDLRGDGGYVVAPPSIHSSGNVYQWVKNKSSNDIPVSANFPSIIIRNKENINSIRELCQGVPQGKRNDSIFRITCALKKNGLDINDCLGLAHAVNERNEPPLSESEVEKTVKGIFDRYNEQESVFQFSDNIYRQKTGKLDLATFKYSDVLKKGHALQKLDIKIEWIIENILPKQSIILLHGRGGIGKTWLSLQIGEAVSNGNILLGHATQQTPVYYIDMENSFPVLVERVKKLNIKQMLFWHNSNEIPPPKIDSDEWSVYKDNLPPGLLIIDTLRAFQSLDENDSKHMAEVMSRLKIMRDKGFTILLLHHTPKSNERTYKGSTAIFDLCDHVLSIHSIKRPDMEDEDDEFGKYRWFGTKDKTRYVPYHMSLMFDPDKGFVEVKGPDIDDSEKIKLVITKYIADNDRPPTQSEAIDTITRETEISKSCAQKLLGQGEKVFWISTKGGAKNKKIYEPVFDFNKLIYEAETQKLTYCDETIDLLRKYLVWSNRDFIFSNQNRHRNFDDLIYQHIESLLRCLQCDNQ
ncbi:MAG: hypothetical protein APR62_05195 [Smithella sp. SDB]|nr:MAG: hypothetical protein APR62_05195 [Smithella sp. SDB]